MMLQYKMIGFDFFFYTHLKACPLTLKRVEGREREGEKHPIGCLLHTPWPGTEPTA